MRTDNQILQAVAEGLQLELHRGGLRPALGRFNTAGRRAWKLQLRTSNKAYSELIILVLPECLELYIGLPSERLMLARYEYPDPDCLDRLLGDFRELARK